MPQTAHPKPTLDPRFESDQELNGRERLLTARDAADRLRLSLSWLAKARMRGDGPPYVKLGRSVRYGESALAKWTHSRTRLSTSER
jgi:predicted DNA-binding transcriptional regulator AlpA